MKCGALCALLLEAALFNLITRLYRHSGAAQKHFGRALWLGTTLNLYLWWKSCAGGSPFAFTATQKPFTAFHWHFHLSSRTRPRDTSIRKSVKINNRQHRTIQRRQSMNNLPNHKSFQKRENLCHKPLRPFLHVFSNSERHFPHHFHLGFARQKEFSESLVLLLWPSSI